MLAFYLLAAHTKWPVVIVPGIVGAAIGLAGGLIVPFVVEWVKREHARVTVAGALAAELMGLVHSSTHVAT